MSTHVEPQQQQSRATKAIRRTSHMLARARHIPEVILESKETPPISGRNRTPSKSERRQSDQTLGSAFSTMKRHLSLQRSTSTTRHKRAASDTFYSVPPVFTPPNGTPQREIPPNGVPIPRSTTQAAGGASRAPDDIRVPALLQNGIPMLKVSEKNVKQRRFKIDPDQGLILWESKKSGISQSHSSINMFLLIISQ